MQIKWIRKVRSDGRHNAFTGLARFNGLYVLAFRNGSRHWSKDEQGRQVIMTSADGEAWTLLHEKQLPTPPHAPPGTPIEYRDSYLLPLDTELRLYSFGLGPLLPTDEWAVPAYSNVQITRDGRTWTEPRVVCEDAILWKPIFWQDRFWCAGYRRTPEVRYQVELYQSPNGLTWTRHSPITVGTEAFLLPVGADVLRAYIRAERMPYHMEMWDSRPPYTIWQKAGAIPRIIQAPHIMAINGENYLFGRETPGYGEFKPAGSSSPALRRTKIWRLRGTEAEQVLELPSGGDTSYTGTALRPDGLLLVSYYSQHEREIGVPDSERGGNDKPADLFVAGIQP